MKMANNESNNSAMLDKIWRVIVIIGILGGWIWMAAILYGRVGSCEEWIKDHKVPIDQVPILCEQLKYTNRRLDSIEKKLDYLMRRNGWRPGE